MVSEAHFIFSQLISLTLLGIGASNYFSFWGAVGEKTPVGGSDLNEWPRSPGECPAMVAAPVSSPAGGGEGQAEVRPEPTVFLSTKSTALGQCWPQSSREGLPPIEDRVSLLGLPTSRF